MKFISHRGNLYGADPEKENDPRYIEKAMLHCDVEVDLFFLDECFWLGHDFPKHQISLSWIEKYKKNIWFHCKNLEAAWKIGQINSTKFFCHSSDPYVLINTGHIWVHDLSLDLSSQCIIPLIDLQSLIKFPKEKVFAICSDYPNEYI